jgi:hypothetical protein
MEQHHTIIKPIPDNSVDKSFPTSDRFPRKWGTWTLETIKGVTVDSENLDDLEQYPGAFVYNSNHQFGYKFNRLYGSWRIYDFDRKVTLR